MSELLSFVQECEISSSEVDANDEEVSDMFSSFNENMKSVINEENQFNIEIIEIDQENSI
jgi:hypothetical protein